MRGRLNNSEVYLDEDQLPAFSLSVTALTDPSKIKGTTSTTLRILATPEAKRVAGSEFMAQRALGRPVLRIGEDSVDLFRSEVKVLEQDRNEIEAIGVGGNATWFDYAKRTNIRDFDLGESIPISEDSIKASWTDEEGLIYFPLIDFGYLEGRPNTDAVDLWRMRPALRLHKLIEALLKPSGYRIQAKGKLAERWKKFVVMQPSDAVRTPHFYGHPQGATVNPGDSYGYTLTDLGTTPDPLLLDQEQDPGGNYLSAEYEMPAGYTELRVRVDGVGLNFDPFDLPPDGERFYLHLYDFTAGAVLGTVSKTYDSAQANIRWWHTFPTVPVPVGNHVGIAVQREVGGYSAGTVENVLEALATYQPVDILWSDKYYLYNGAEWDPGRQMPVALNSCAPDMSLIDLIKAISESQCLVFTTNERTRIIEARYWSDYFQKPVATARTRNWTLRMDHSKPPRKRSPEMPKRVLFRWEEDRGDRLLYVALAVSKYPGYANADVELPDAIGSEQTITIPFASTVMGTALGGLTIPVMIARDGEYQVDDYNREARMLIADGVLSGTWKLGPVSDSTYPNCYFVTNTAEGIPLPWGNASSGYPLAVADQWKRRLDEMKRARVLEAYFLLRDNELRNFHHGIPTLVDDGSGPRWYYVQEIFQHRFGKNTPTKCVLVEIPGAEVSLSVPVNGPISYPPVIPEPETSFEWDDDGVGGDEWDDDGSGTDELIDQ